MNANGGQIVIQRAGPVAALIVEIAEIEMRQRILGIHFYGLAIVLLGQAPIAGVEIDRSQVHQRARRCGIDLGGLLIRRDYLLGRRAILFQIQAFFEPMLGLAAGLHLPHGFRFLGLPRESQQLADLGLIEIQNQLARDSLHLFVARELNLDLPALRVNFDFGQRILEFAEMLSHRLHGFADLDGGDAALAQAHQSSEGQDVGEAEGFAGRQQILFLPTLELTLGNAQLPANIFPRVGLLSCWSGHGESLAEYRDRLR